MSSIVVDFEVLPEDGPLERSATQVCGDLHQQLRDPSSILRGGEFARFAAQASLSGGGLQDDAPPSMSTPYEPREGHGVDLGHGEPTPPSPSMRHGMRTEASFPSGPSGGQWGAQPSRGPSQDHYAPSAMNASSRYSSAPAPSHGGGNLQGFSNVELVDRISHLERQLAHTAAGGHSQEPPPTLQRRSVQAEALEEKCHHLQHRLDTLERELRTEQEGHRLHRGKAEQAEQRLKDREQLLVHAKEMWMQENVRASKLAKALTAAEDQLADQERRLTETSERYDRAQQEALRRRLVSRMVRWARFRRRRVAWRRHTTTSRVNSAMTRMPVMVVAMPQEGGSRVAGVWGPLLKMAGLMIPSRMSLRQLRRTLSASDDYAF